MSERRRSIATAVAGALGALAIAAGAVPAQASTTICVALVVDFGDLGGGVHSSCATVHSGATGYDVLSAGGHRFTICSNGVLGSIDGKPSDGCTEKNDSVHYWSYWHRAPGSTTWRYSDEGGGTYQPRARSTEGWHWMKSPPANVPYSQICRPTPSPQPTHQATSPTLTANPTSTHASLVATKAPRRHVHAVVSPSGSATPTPTQLPTSTPTPTPATRALAEPPSSHGSGVPVVPVAGLAGAVMLGAGAWWRLRRGGTP